MTDMLRVQDGQLIYRNGVVLGAVYQEVDGYFVFWPEQEGCWSSSLLRGIADLLDSMNQPWDAEVQSFFKTFREDNE